MATIKIEDAVGIQDIYYSDYWINNISQSGNKLRKSEFLFVTHTVNGGNSLLNLSTCLDTLFIMAVPTSDATKHSFKIEIISSAFSTIIL